MGFYLQACCALALIFIAYILLRRKYRYWSDKGVSGPKPIIIFGNMVDMIINRHSIGTQFQLLYKKTKHRPYAGIYMFFRPALLINSLDMVKTVFIRDFSHFTDHGLTFDKRTQPLVNHLFNVNGSRWRGLRNKVSPAFTSSKMKYMFDTMVNCGIELEHFLKKDAEGGNEIDVKDIMGKFTTDVIVSCAFGLESNSFLNSETEFRTLGKRVFDFDFKRSLAIFLTLFAPGIQKIVKLPILEKPLSRFFIKTVDDTVKYREEKGFTRNDLMQLMIRIKNNESLEDKPKSQDSVEEFPNLKLDNLELAALAFGFFVGGFETSSTTLTFIFYELAKNRDIQDKLRSEIDDVLSKNDNKITYDTLNSMTYMYQVIEESLRIHPPIPQLLRVCTKDYVIPDTNTVIDKGTPVFISVQGIHMDPEIYPEPEKFNPDRFSTENKELRDHYSFLSFGEGPRMCIGNRFAIMQMRIALVSVLKCYQVSLVGDGEIKITKNSVLSQPKNLMLRLNKRSLI